MVKSEKTPEVKTGKAKESAWIGAAGSRNPAFGRERPWEVRNDFGLGPHGLVAHLPSVFCGTLVSVLHVKEALPLLVEFPEHWVRHCGTPHSLCNGNATRQKGDVTSGLPHMYLTRGPHFCNVPPEAGVPQNTLGETLRCQSLEMWLTC